MPRGDRTGPEGSGPQTGRAMGYCSGSNAPGFTRGYSGRGMGYGRGMGRGYARGGPVRGFFGRVFGSGQGRAMGFGGGRGRGMGRGMGGGYGYYEPDYNPAGIDRPAGYYRAEISRDYPEPAPEEEKAHLEDIVKGMERELEDIRKRIEDLNKKE